MFVAVATLAPNQSTTVLMAIDYNDTTQPARFDVVTQSRRFPVEVSAPVGELLHPNTLTENDFLSAQRESRLLFVSSHQLCFLCFRTRLLLENVLALFQLEVAC